MKTATAKRLVSIIIPIFNEAENIYLCLRSLTEQSFKDFEVILVDDSSTDDTVERVRKFNIKKRIDLKMLKQSQHQERGIVRNLGAKKAKGEYLLFIDADMQLEKDVLSECIELIKNNENIKGVIISEESFGIGFWAQCKRLEKKCYLGDDSIEAARFFDKETFWRVGGWDEEMISGEDWDLTRRVRIKYKIGRINAKIFHNEGRLTLWRIAKKKFYYASKAQTYLKKYPLKVKDIILFIFRPAYFKNWKLLLKNPLYTLGLVIIKLIEIMAGILGFAYSKLVNRWRASP